MKEPKLLPGGCEQGAPPPVFTMDLGEFLRMMQQRQSGTPEDEEAAPEAASIAVRHPNSARFHELLREIGELHDKKQADYGRGDDPFANIRASQEWGVPAWVGALVRLNDKVRRLQNFAQKGALRNESAEDSMRDIAVYAIISLVLYEQEGQEENANA